MSAAPRALLTVIGLALIGTCSPCRASAVQMVEAPLAFEENRGQSSDAVDFLARGPGYMAWLTAQEAVLRLRVRAGEDAAHGAMPRQGQDRYATVRLALIDSSPSAVAQGEDRQAALSHYLRIDASAKPVQAVARFARVRYRSVYPGIDLVYYGNAQGSLEYDFVVAAGADPTPIGLQIAGAQSLQLDTDGNLNIETALGRVVQHAPIAYQMVDGRRVAVTASFQLRNQQLRFALADYDRSRDLVIDPTLVYSTLLGGSGEDVAEDVAVNGAGEAYVTGYTDSTNFPLANALDPTPGGARDAFITKYNATGSAILFSTYVGGANDQEGRGIALDGSGRIYVAGLNKVTDPSGDAFAIRVSSNGATLEYSRTFGGSSSDDAVDIAVTSAGIAYVGGNSSSSNLPTINPIHGYQGGVDSMLARIDAAGNRDYTTYVGAVGDQVAESIAIHEASGHAYIAGTNNRFDASGEVFLIKLDADNVFPEAGEWSRNISTSGSNGDQAYGVAVSAAGDAYVTGSTASPGFPALNALQPTLAGNRDAFLFRVDANNNLIFSTFLGANYRQIGRAVALDAANNILVAGYAADFGGSQNAMVLRVNAAATQVDYRAEFGHASSIGNVYNQANGVAAAPDGDACLVGRASVGTSAFVTTPGVAQGSHAGGLYDAFVARVDAAAPTLNLAADYAVIESAGLISVNLTLNAPSAIAVTANWTTANGSAVAPGDYNANSGTVTLDPGQTSRSFYAFTVQNDALDEANENLLINLSGANNAVLGDAQLNITINDDDNAPSLSVDNGGCTVNEPPGATSDCWFVYRLSVASGLNVGFTTQTVAGSASATDFNGHGPTARSIPAGQTTLTVAVPVVADIIDENNEAFTLSASGVSNASPSSLDATGTINDDDPAPSVSVDLGGCTVSEGTGTAVNCDFIYRLSRPSSFNIDFTTQTIAVSADGTDYVAHGPTARGFAPMQTTLTVSIPIVTDALDENNETFTLAASGINNATPASLNATGTINDDDATPTLSIDNGGCAVGEGNSGQSPCNFVFRLSAVSGRNVDFRTAALNNGSASLSDFTAEPPTMRTIPAGQISLTVSVPVIGDTLDENTETFRMYTDSVANASPFSLEGLGTINDDDNPPTVTISDRNCTEGDSGATSCALTISLSAASGFAVGGNYASANGGASPATVGLDYNQVPSTAWSIDAGQTSFAFNVIIVGETLDEADETFLVNLSSLTNAAASGNDLQASVTIGDNDNAPTVGIADRSCTEGNSGSSACAFTISLSRDSGLTVGGIYATANGSAAAPGDFAAVAGTAWNITPGQTSTTVNVSIAGDTIDETNETFLVNLAGLSNAAASGNDVQASATISDDDAANGQVRMTECVAEISELVPTLQITVERIGGSNGAIGVSYATANGGALAGADYTTSSGGLSWANGDVGLRLISVPLINSATRENREDFDVILNTPTGGASIAGPNATQVWILDGQDQVFEDGFGDLPPCL